MNEALPILGKIAVLWADVIVVENRKYDPNPILKFFDPETRKAAFIKISKEQAKKLIEMLKDAIGETEDHDKVEEASDLFRKQGMPEVIE